VLTVAVMLILVSLLESGCVHVTQRCDVEELCKYHQYYDEGTPVERASHFKNMMGSEQVGVYIYGVMYQHHKPYAEINILAHCCPVKH